MNRDFAPDLQTALARVQRINPAAYASTRNALSGAVTGLSPYLTHGLLELPQVLALLGQSHALTAQHKLVMEFGWREFFAHVWRHQGEHIFSDLRAPVTRMPYARVMPEDIRSASTGVPAIDQAVQQLYRTGYLHNHARLWLASYVVHLRKVHWRVGADWLYGHLLDGDLASNHLSWQWVAGTFSIKPYLFNAENVARYAPSDWHSGGTVIDTSYEALETLARTAPDVGPEPTRPTPTEAPELLAAPQMQSTLTADALPHAIELVHPWHLGPARGAAYRLAVIHLPFHARFPWSLQRWLFVMTRLLACTDALFVGDVATLYPRLQGCDVQVRDTDNPGYSASLRAAARTLHAVPRFLGEPTNPCQSFSKFYGSMSGKWHA